MTTAAVWVEKVNQKLKGCGATLEVSGRGNNLYIRGTFPDKPWEGAPTGKAKKQRRISLRMKALSLEDVKRAASIARQVGIDLNEGNFDWRKFSNVEEPKIETGTIASWAAQFEEAKRSAGKINDYTWKRSYQRLIEKLPAQEQPSEELFIEWILKHDPSGSTMRRNYLAIAKGICQLAGISTTRLDRLSRPSTTKALNPRHLINDAEIEQTALSITDPEWRWCYAMMAVYGLRPHELFRLDLRYFPDVRVLDNTKTGERLTPPIHAQWVETFGLTGEILLPRRLVWTQDTPNWHLGGKIWDGFDHLQLGTPYNLRHCYARRCLELGLTSDVSAALMGHSRNVHEQRYRAFIHSRTYVEIAKRITNASPDNQRSTGNQLVHS